jgi:uncharacterized SAM-binding protein YcdF (DUF218 family)
MIGDLLQPSSIILIEIFGSTLFLIFRRSGYAVLFLAFGVMILALCAWTPFATIIMLPLEERFPRSANISAVTGIIVIGGAFDVAQSFNRKDVSLNMRSARLTAFAGLARRYPKAQLVFSGGRASKDIPTSEAALARGLLADLGVDVSRVKFEEASRNTHENAEFSRRLVTLQMRDRWLLVTSAADMPRAIGCFRSVGWPVVAFPVDYHTRHEQWSTPSLGHGLELLDWGVHEWVGLLYYRIEGWIPSILPGPKTA